MHIEDTDHVTKNFIVFEGIDGSGTTTQMRRLAAAMERKSLPYMVTAEPTTRPEGALIRRILKGEIAAEPGTVAYLFAADRHQHVYSPEGILQAAKSGAITLCDRYVLSSLAYQGMTCGKELPAMLNSPFPRPGLTIFFDVSAETAMRRMAARSQLEIYEKLHIQKQVRAAYREVIASARADGWKIVEIDAEKSIDEVTAQVFAAIGEHLGIALG
jgi:dTMP kinase